MTFKKATLFLVLTLISLLSLSAKEKEINLFASVLHKSPKSKISANLMIEIENSKCKFLFMDPLGRRIQISGLIPGMKTDCNLKSLLTGEILKNNFFSSAQKKGSYTNSLIGKINVSLNKKENWQYKEILFKNNHLNLSWLVKYERNHKQNLLESQFFDLRNNSLTIFKWKELEKRK